MLGPVFGPGPMQCEYTIRISGDITFKVNNGQDDVLTVKWTFIFLFRTFDDEGFKTWLLESL